jgi:hypothetical protein
MCHYVFHTLSVVRQLEGAGGGNIEQFKVVQLVKKLSTLTDRKC